MAEAAALVDPFETVDWSELATKRDLERFATKEDVARCATKEDLERFATKEDLARTLETVEAWLDEERSNARLNEAMLGVSETIRGVSDRFDDTVRKQTWAIVVGMPAMLVALFTLAQMLP